MRVKYFTSMLLLTAVMLSFSAGGAEAADVSVNISGYLPAPPGVAIRVDAGRPYYVERDRRVYMERRPYKPYKKHHKNRHHEDDGRDRGHDRHEGRGGHGR
jgi:hypothetical protein